MIKLSVDFSLHQLDAEDKKHMEDIKRRYVELGLCEENDEIDERILNTILSICIRKNLKDDLRIIGKHYEKKESMETLSL